MAQRYRQHGVTILGFILVAAVVLSIVMLGFLVLPSYIEYFSVEKTLRQTLATSREGITLNDFRRDFDLKASADYIYSVRGTDVELVKQGNTLVASAAWTKTLHVIGNVNLLLEFEASASK